MRWSTLGRLAWEAIKPPDPNSIGEKIKKAIGVYSEVGNAAALVNEILPEAPAQERKQET